MQDDGEDVDEVANEAADGEEEDGGESAEHVGSRRMTKMFATQLHVLCPIAPLTVGSYV